MVYKLQFHDCQFDLNHYYTLIYWYIDTRGYNSQRKLNLFDIIDQIHSLHE